MELAEWIAAEQKEAFNNKYSLLLFQLQISSLKFSLSLSLYFRHILELGSGIGFLGLTVLKLTSPLSYTFTDCNVDVLKLLKTNIDINNIPGVSSIDSH